MSRPAAAPHVASTAHVPALRAAEANAAAARAQPYQRCDDAQPCRDSGPSKLSRARPGPSSRDNDIFSNLNFYRIREIFIMIIRKLTAQRGS